MHNWIVDYHHALLLRLFGMMLLFVVPLLCGTLARHIWLAWPAFNRHISQGIPICRHSKP